MIIAAMPQTFDIAINLVRLLHRQGSFVEASKAAMEACELADKESNLNGWVEAARLALQCHIELLTEDKVAFLYDELLSRIDLHPDNLSFQLRAQHLLGMSKLSKNEIAEAKTIFENALQKALETKEHEIIARLLHAQTFILATEQNFAQAGKTIEKTMLLGNELDLKEIIISCLILKGYILASEKKFAEGIEATWLAYEEAKKIGHSYLITNVLIQLAVIYQDLGKTDLAEIYRNLVLKGLDETLYPRVYKLAQARFAQVLQPAQDKDIILDSNSFKIRARHKGLVDFKHQHILFELIRTFSSSPGTRFSKEQLIEKVWNMAYDPAIHDNLIYVSIKRLRTLLEPNPEAPQYVLRDRSGYYMPISTSVKMKDSELT